ncbi:MAG: ParB/RepB/Spo0J family partition protein [Oscillospiraceae bacterium]|nr:ParB/RepB/Spo0J family partition protein [Oscillospiraceae bacterium]
MPERKFGIDLKSYDDIFKTEEEREEDKLSKIRDIPISEIDDFPDHPFMVRDDEDMQNLIESIKERGVITPAMVRKKEDGRYELISGHRRKRACELAGMDTLRCEVVDMDRDEATIMMVESNFQRSNILPSEKAFAYKMRLEAMKRTAGRPSKNASPVATNFPKGRSDVELSDQTGESKDTIRRYIRLTELVPELRDMVDEGRIKMRPAVELSYLDKESQKDVVEQIEYTQGTPTHDQAIRMRKLQDDGNLTPQAVMAVMQEIKPSQKEKFVFSGEKIRQYLPKTLPFESMEDYVCKALDYYRRHMRAKENSR